MLSLVNSLAEPSRPHTVSRITHEPSLLLVVRSCETSRNMPKQQDRRSSKTVSKMCRRLAKIRSLSRLRNEIPMRQSVSSSPREMNTKNLAHLAKWSSTVRVFRTVRPAMETSIRISPSPSSEHEIPLSPKLSTYPKSANMSTSSCDQIAYEPKTSGSRRRMPEKISHSI